MSEWMIYGANGYTGELIAREAVRRGMRPLLAGRGRDRVAALAGELGLAHRAFSLEHPDLKGVRLVLHCAGPFSETSDSMVNACLAARAHYLDITGEFDVFESIYLRDAEARRAGIVLLPGVGFDVVPTDGVAAMLAAEMPDAQELWLAFANARGSSMSRGTLRTMIQGLGSGGAIRRGGEIVRVPQLFDVREIPFASGPRVAMTIPWGDIASAYRSTRIPNIRVYIASSPRAIAKARKFARYEVLFQVAMLRKIAQAFVKRGGPSGSQRAAGSVEIWGRVTNGSEERTMTLSTPEGYAFTVDAALASVERVLASDALSGALTPSMAFGAGFVLTLPGVRRG